MWNADEQWLMHTYIVRDDHPFLGKVGANVSIGEVAWQTWGNPGSIQYKTNGWRVLWTPAGSNLEIKPIQAYDAQGAPALLSGALNPAFDGNVVSLEYPAPLPGTYPTGWTPPANVGAYYISFIGRIQLQVMDVATGLMSNTILLQLDAPPVIQDAPEVAGYLYLNSDTGLQQGISTPTAWAGRRFRRSPTPSRGIKPSCPPCPPPSTRPNTAKWNIIGGRILQDRELQLFEDLERDAPTKGKYRAGRAIRHRRSLERECADRRRHDKASAGGHLQAHDGVRACAFEAFTSTDAPAMVFTPQAAGVVNQIFLNYVVWRVTEDGAGGTTLEDPSLIDSGTGEATAEMGQLQVVIGRTTIPLSIRASCSTATACRSPCFRLPGRPTALCN